MLELRKRFIDHACYSSNAKFKKEGGYHTQTVAFNLVIDTASKRRTALWDGPTLKRKVDKSPHALDRGRGAGEPIKSGRQGSYA